MDCRNKDFRGLLAYKKAFEQGYLVFDMTLLFPNIIV